MAKVCVLASYAPSLINFRGALLEAMGQAGHTISASAPENVVSIAPILRTLDVEYFQVPMSRSSVRPYGDLLYVFRLWRIWQHQRPDMVFAYTIKPVVFGLLAARLAGVRRRVALITGLGYAFTDPSSLARWLVRWFACRLYRLALRGAELVFFQNPDDLGEFKRLAIIGTKAKVCLVNGSGVDLTHFEVKPIPRGPHTFLMIARLLRDKGLVEFAGAAKWVKERHPGARFVLVGPFDSSPAAITADEIDAWSRQGAIEYKGELSDVRPELAACSVYVLPSYYGEGTPRTVLEAMAVGRPVITTDAPGCRETVIDGENGILVPIKSVTKLAAAMERFILEPDLAVRMGRRSREIAEDRYDVHKVNAVMLRRMDLAR